MGSICSECGKRLTAEEIEYLGDTCCECEEKRYDPLSAFSLEEWSIMSAEAEYDYRHDMGELG